MATATYSTNSSSVVLQNSAEESSSVEQQESSPKPRPGLDVERGNAEKQTFLQRLRTFGPIETYLFLNLFSVALRLYVNVTLTLLKACVTEVGLSYEECIALDVHSSKYKEADRIAQKYIMISSWVSTVTTMVMGTLIGSFCDKYQRKIPLILAPLGIAIDSAFSIFGAAYMESPLVILVIGNVPGSLFGGSMIIFSGVYAYVSQVTTVKSRQLRFAILQMLLLAGITFGTILSGFMFQNKNYIMVFSLSIASNAIAMIILALFMEEKDQKTKNMTYGEIFKAFFSPDSLRDSYRLVVAPREGNSRLQIWLLLLLSFIIGLPQAGMRQLTLLYVKKRYGWNVDTLSYVTGGLRLGGAIFTIIAVRVFTKKLKIRDSIIAVIGLASFAADYMIRGLAETGVIYALAYIAGALSGCSKSATDNYLTRLLRKDEIGRVLVFSSLVDLTTPAVGTSFFSMISQKLEDTIPGAMFISAAILALIPAAIVVWINFYGTIPATGKKAPEESQTRESADDDGDDLDNEETPVIEEKFRSSSFIHL